MCPSKRRGKSSSRHRRSTPPPSRRRSRTTSMTGMPRPRAPTVSSDGKKAWFDEDLETEKLGAARGSGVLVKDGGRWKIAQYNLSIPIPNARFAEVHALLSAAPKINLREQYTSVYKAATST